MPMSGMTSAFYSSSTTSLFFIGWTPESTGAYAGTCIFLIFLATSFRVLAAGKYMLEQRWLDRDLDRRYVTVRGKPREAEQIRSASESTTASLISERGVEEHVKVVRKIRRSVTPWRLSVDLPRAAYSTLIAGVGYLL
ncbi:MAG: hypothetical protein Q9170_001648 [Blastenia crenularia]